MPQIDNEEINVMKTWKGIWSEIKKGTFPKPEQDSLSSMVFETIRKISGRMRDQSFLEAGSGLGFASLKISLFKGKVVLLDVNSNILLISRRFFSKRGVLDRAYFVVGTISHLPFRNNSFDVVWNSGVLEHFKVFKQREFLREMARVLKPRRLLAVIVPNKDAFVYNFSRILRQKIGRWGYGYEEPFTKEHLEELMMDHVAVCETIRFAFSWQLKFLPGSVRILVLAKRIMETIASFVEIVLTKLLGHSPQLEGYLVAGAGLKKAGTQLLRKKL